MNLQKQKILRRGGKNTQKNCIKKILITWKNYTLGIKVHKKDLHNPDKHDSMIIHLEPDILECKVKGALESTTTNKASGGDGIPAELF